MSLIFDIAKGSFVDGPGIRTTVFFKGCPLRCPWCHNPESQSYTEELFFSAEKCISCGNCTIGRECYTGAKKTVGHEYKPSELLNLLLADKPYYTCSNGGVTFSGGEPLGFISYLKDILPALKKEKIHVAIQTSGYFDYDQCYKTLSKYVDLIFFDIKILNREEHEKIIGKPNDKILSNFEKLLSSGIKITPRVPLVPGYTATKDNLKGIARYFRDLEVKECEFIYYNPSSDGKVNPLSNEEYKALTSYFKDNLGNKNE